MGLFNWFNKQQPTLESTLESKNVSLEENFSTETSKNAENIITEFPLSIEEEMEASFMPVEKPVEDTISENEFDCSDLGIYDPTLDLADYLFPELSLLNEQEFENEENQTIEPKRVIEVLESFGIKTKSIHIDKGAIVTLIEVVLGDGIKIAILRKLQEDIAICLSVSRVMIVSIPERGSAGIVISNENPQILTLSSVLNTEKFKNSKYELPLAIGKTMTNDPFIVDLTQMPHLLIAGATGQGKSVALNGMITSLLYKFLHFILAHR